MKAKKVIAQIARERNLSPREVEEAMKCAIREAMATKDLQAQAMWKEIAPDGKEPSLDRFLEYCANRLKKK